eukprot:TCONS_00027648-protein
MAPNHYREVIFHALCTVFYAYTHTQRVFKPGVTDTYGGNLKFFTMWTLYLTNFYHGAALISSLSNIISGENDNSSNKSKSMMFHSMLFPSSMITCCLFWGIYAIHPDLMVPEAIRKLMPIAGFYNNAVHTAPLVTIFAEILITSHVAVSTLHGALIFVFYGGTYLVWICWVAYKTNIWVYPFLRALNGQMLVLFFAGVFILALVLVNVCKKLVVLCNGNACLNKEGIQKKKKQ